MKFEASLLERPRTFVWLVVLVVGTGCGLWALITIAYPTLGDRASFGSLFGGINALFAGLAFAALAYTLILQQRSLTLQQNQLEEQHAELIRQNARVARQTFETMLGQLLQFHHTLTSGIRARIGGADYDGRDALRALADELRGFVATQAQQEAKAPSIVVAQEAYEAFRKKYRAMLDHYFRNLYHVIKFIDDEDLDDARRYTSLVRAQLSPAELLLLLYNGLTPHGEKMKPLIEKYSLLAQLPDSEIPVPSHKALYGVSAYG